MEEMGIVSFGFRCPVPFALFYLRSLSENFRYVFEACLFATLFLLIRLPERKQRGV